MLPALLMLGLGTWVSFGYIGARHQRRSWLIAAAVYFILDILGFALVGLTPDSGPGADWSLAGGFLFLTLWPAGVLHTVVVNFATRLPLLAGQGTGPLPARSRERAAPVTGRAGGR